MSKSLPERANLDHLKNEAKALLKAKRRGDTAACDTLRCLARLQSASDEEALAAEVSLQEMQHALACEYGLENWKALADHVNGAGAFAERVRDAFEAFTSKGPDHDSTRSPWEQGRHEEFRELLQAGDEGFRVMMGLARSDNGRARNAAAIFFVQSADPRAIDELRALMSDEAVMVRSRALRFYAGKIHPARERVSPWSIGEPADTVPEGVDAILPLVKDDNVKIRVQAVAALSAYAKLGDAGIDRALQQALSDPKHKVRHAAAAALGVPCPGCGKAVEAV